MTTPSPTVMQQLLLLPKGAAFVVCGVHNVTNTERVLHAMGRTDAVVRSEYWVEGLTWVREPARTIVMDAGFRSESVWKSDRLLLALEVLRLLGRLG